MIESTLVRPCSSSPSPLLLESKDSRLHRTRFGSTVCCSSSSSSSSSRNHAYIPKLEPFSRTKFDRVIKDPPLIEKSENELSDYCSTLEGDESYSCWSAYFELKDLEKEAPKSDVEKLILQAGGVKSLIGFIHGVAEMYRGNKKRAPTLAQLAGAERTERLTPVPDGLPKSQAELDEEESAKMPDSPFTRLLRTKGKFPAWYSPAPDHETD